MSVAMNSSETIQSIIRWFETAKPEPTIQDQVRQIAVHAEEFAEMVGEIIGPLYPHSWKALVGAKQ